METAIKGALQIEIQEDIKSVNFHQWYYLRTLIYYLECIREFTISYTLFATIIPPNKLLLKCIYHISI